MERLTMWTDEGRNAELVNAKGMQECINRLAEFEDLKATPADLADAARSAVKYAGQALYFWTAEAEGRMVMAPCAPGEKLFTPGPDGIRTATVLRITYGLDEAGEHTTRMVDLKLEDGTECAVRLEDISGTWYRKEEEAAGKTAGNTAAGGR